MRWDRSPSDPGERERWQERASAVGAYRELFGHDDERRPTGPEPVSRRSYSVLCSASDTLTIHCTSGLTAEVRPEERELVRAKLEEALDTGWPGYVTTALADAQPAALTPAS